MTMSTNKYGSVVFLSVALLFHALSLPLWAEGQRGRDEFTWHAQLQDEFGQPVPYANVIVEALDLGTASNDQGYVELFNLPLGGLQVTISTIGYENQTLDIQLPQEPGALAIITVPHAVLEGKSVTVTITGMPTDVLNSERTVTVLEGQYLQRHQKQSVSATLANAPGVQILSQGPAIAKPVIRGMTNQRIVILKDGIRQEGQQWGGHHTPEADILSVGRIEVLRGPNGLIYGADALGGVIMLQTPVLSTLDEGAPGFRLVSRLGFQANSTQGQGAIGLQRSWERSALRINVSGRLSDNYAVPGDTQFLEEQPATAFRQINGNIHYLHKYDNLKIEVINSNYWEEQTLIGEGHWHNTGGGANGDEPYYHVLGAIISPTLHQDLTAKGTWMLSRGWLEYDIGTQLNHRTGGAEDEEPVIDLITKTNAANLRWRYLIRHKMSSAVGVSFSSKTSESKGVEKLLPDYLQHSAGIYTQYSWLSKNLKITGGLRSDGTWYEIQATTASGIECPEDVSKEYFPILSGGLGLVLHQSDSQYSVALNLGTGWRPPNPYELYIHGVHHGDWKIEIGDAALVPETSVNTDLILRHQSSKHSSEFSIFYNRLYEFITSSPSGEWDGETGIPIYYMTQGNAQTFGSELRWQQNLCTHWQCEFGWDIMWGESLEQLEDVDHDGQTEQALPGINPPRILLGTSYNAGDIFGFGNVQAELNGQFVFAQNALAEFENLIDDGYGNPMSIKPQAYQLLGLAIHGSHPLGDRTIDLSLGIDNLLNEQYYSHLSRYKGIAFDPGFNLHGDMRFTF